MSGLHEAVTRAIADAQYNASDNAERDLRLARAAIAVCLAEAQRAVERPEIVEAAARALVNYDRTVMRSYDYDAKARVVLAEALAVLAALAEEQRAG